MKTNELSADRPPRPPIHPQKSRRWRIQRYDDKTVINPRNSAPLEVPTCLTDEQLDTLRVAYEAGATFPATAEELTDIVNNQVYKNLRQDYAIFASPKEWKDKVGIV